MKKTAFWEPKTWQEGFRILAIMIEAMHDDIKAMAAQHGDIKRVQANHTETIGGLKEDTTVIKEKLENKVDKRDFAASKAKVLAAR